MMHSTKRKRLRTTAIDSGINAVTNPRCLTCRRPLAVCHCDLIPNIKNETEVLIIQDISERSHPFNTARMAHQALENSKLISDYSDRIQRHSHLLSPNAGLLYPAKNATDIAELTPDEIPDQLVLLDGTWNQAKRIYRQWPALNRLKHLRIQPKRPGNYRIRLEPNEYALSTVEAVVAALSHIQPGIDKLDQLIQAFDTMVDRQLSHPQADYSNADTPKTPTLNIPAILSQPNSNLIVAYGEAEPILRGSPKKIKRTPVFWVAKRLYDGQKFQSAIESDLPITADLLEYFQLPEATFANSLSAAEFKKRWQAFFPAIGHFGRLQPRNCAIVKEPWNPTDPFVGTTFCQF